MVVHLVVRNSALVGELGGLLVLAISAAFYNAMGGAFNYALGGALVVHDGAGNSNSECISKCT